MSTNGKTKLHVHGNDLSQEEVATIARHFGTDDIARIPGGIVNEIKKALSAAAKTSGVILFQKGMHFMGILNLPDREWYTFERDGRQIVIRRKTPGSPELQEVARIATVAASA